MCHLLLQSGAADRMNMLINDPGGTHVLALLLTACSRDASFISSDRAARRVS